MNGVKIKLERSNEPPKTKSANIQAKPHRRKTLCPICGRRLFDVNRNLLHTPASLSLTTPEFSKSFFLNFENSEVSMKTTFLIWKTPPIGGAAPDWQKITGKQFNALVNSPEGIGRYFIKLPSIDPGGRDGAVVMEATEADYMNWKHETNRADYLRRRGKGITVISYHAMESDDSDCYNLLHNNIRGLLI